MMSGLIVRHLCDRKGKQRYMILERNFKLSFQTFNGFCIGCFTTIAKSSRHTWSIFGAIQMQIQDFEKGRGELVTKWLAMPTVGGKACSI